MVTIFPSLYGAVTHVQLPALAYAVALALGYHHLGVFYEVYEHMYPGVAQSPGYACS